MKELEQIGVLAAIAFIGYLFYTKKSYGNASSFSTGGNGVPAFLSYNVPNLSQAMLPIPSITSGQENSQGSSCSACNFFGGSNFMSI